MAQNPTLIDLVNNVSMKLTGRAASMNGRPTKAEIIQALNDAQDAIVRDKPAYTFLNKIGSVANWRKAPGYFFYNPGWGLEDATPPHSMNPSVLGATWSNTTVSYFAEKFTQAASTVSIPTTVSTRIQVQNPGFANLDGTLQVLLVGVSTKDTTDVYADANMPDGVPNLNDIKASSDVITVLNGVGSDANLFGHNDRPTLTFTFDETYAIGSGESIYAVLVWTPSVLNGANFFIYQNDGVTSGYSYSWDSATIVGGPTYPIQRFTTTAGSFGMRMKFWRAVYAAGIHEVSLPTDVATVQRMYDPISSTNLLPFPYSAYQYRPTEVPTGVFVLTGMDTSGVLKAKLFPGRADITKFYVEYKAKSVWMGEDTDISLIPDGFRDVLIWKAIIELFALNNGIPGNPETFEALYMSGLRKLNETYLPYDDVAVTVNLGGSTPIDTINARETPEDYPGPETPNAWEENKSGTGGQGGI